MSVIQRVSCSLKDGITYSPSDVAMMARVDQQQAEQALYLLAKGGIVEVVTKDRYRKNRKYKTRQRSLL